MAFSSSPLGIVRACHALLAGDDSENVANMLAVEVAAINARESMTLPVADSTRISIDNRVWRVSNIQLDLAISATSTRYRQLDGQGQHDVEVDVSVVITATSRALNTLLEADTATAIMGYAEAVGRTLHKHLRGRAGVHRVDVIGTVGDGVAPIEEGAPQTRMWLASQTVGITAHAKFPYEAT